MHSRYWLLGAFGAVLLFAGCAAPEEAGRASAPVSVSTSASASASPAATTAAATTEAPAPVAETPVVEPATEAPAETVAAPAPAAVTVPAPAPVTEDAPAEAPAAEAPAAEEPAAAPSGYGCDAAIAYLQANAHPAFTIVCPGYAFGGQAVTCINHAPQCPNSAVIIINVPCEIAYKNEAANSWTLYNSTGAAIDPFGASC